MYIYLNYTILNKDKSKVYKCIEYKAQKKCSTFIKLNQKDEITDFSNLHNHKVDILKRIKVRAFVYKNIKTIHNISQIKVLKHIHIKV